jgi:hypothetical protein
VRPVGSGSPTKNNSPITPASVTGPALAFGKGRLWLRRSRIRVPGGVVDVRRT